MRKERIDSLFDDILKMISLAATDKGKLDSSEQPFFEMLGMPIFCNVLWEDHSAAIHCDRGDIRLVFEPASGLIYNDSFDPSRIKYSQHYENSLDFSPRFQAYARSLAKRLINRYRLHQKKILEIGCGKGEFLLQLCELGENYGIGFDPSYVDQDLPKGMSDRVQFIQDFYSQKYFDQTLQPSLASSETTCRQQSNQAIDGTELIICRHTLEHVPEPLKFLGMIRKSLNYGLTQNSQPRSIPLYFEVPNALETIGNLAIWDIIYEHCCYFSSVSLEHYFRNSGFQVVGIYEEFEKQFLGVDVVAASDSPLPAESQQQLIELQQQVQMFEQRCEQKINDWKQVLRQIAQSGHRAVLWGAGSKGVTFLNVLAIDQSIVEWVVDINPRKQGKFVAGTGQLVIAPEQLQSHPPDIVLIANSVYKEEIQASLLRLGIQPQLLCI